MMMIVTTQQTLRKVILTEYPDGYKVYAFECNEVTEITIIDPNGWVESKTADEWMHLAHRMRDLND